MKPSVPILLALGIASFLSAAEDAIDPERAANTIILDEAGVKNLRIETVVAEPRDFETTVFAMKVDRAILHRRIDLRLEARLDEGLVEEVQGLLDRGVSAQRLEQLGLEYREVSSYVLGHTSFDAMVRNLKVAIHRFARRQEVWFRGFERKGIPVRWIEPDDIDAVLSSHRAARDS